MVETLLLSGAQLPMPDHEQVRATAAHSCSLPVLREAAVTHLGEAEHSVDRIEWVLNLGTGYWPATGCA